MLFVEPIVEMIEAVIASTMVVQEDEYNKVVANLLLVGPAGIGKSKILRKFRNVEGVYFETEVTYQQILQTLIPKIQSGEILTLLFPEFNKIVARRSSTRANTLSILNPIIEEGIDSIDMPNVNLHFDPPLRCNMVSAVTTPVFHRYIFDWWDMGFLDRQPQESWSYTKRQINEICKYITHRRYIGEAPYVDRIDEMDVDLSAKEAKKMRPWAKKLATKTENYVKAVCKIRRIPFIPDKIKTASGDIVLREPLPFRNLKYLNLLQMTFAGLRGKTRVHRVDSARLIRDLHWMNLDQNPLPKKVSRRRKS